MRSFGVVSCTVEGSFSMLMQLGTVFHRTKDWTRRQVNLEDQDQMEELIRLVKMKPQVRWATQTYGIYRERVEKRITE